MGLIKVETVAERPITAEMLADTRVLDCLELTLRARERTLDS